MKLGPAFGTIGGLAGTQFIEQSNPYFFNYNDPNFLKTGLFNPMITPNTEDLNIGQ